VTGEPSDEELRNALNAGGLDVVDLDRRPFRYATSAPLELLSCRVIDGTHHRIVFKDLTPARRIADASRKPAALHDPQREIEMYRQVLVPLGVGASLYAAVSEPGRQWLFVEYVDGLPLWQIGEIGPWRAAAEWLARFHERNDVSHLARGVPVLRWDRPRLLDTYERARDALALSTHPRAGELLGHIGDAGWLAERLLRQPRAVIHGEAYPSNLIVANERVVPVDWEMAARGPALIDLAALTVGWSDEPRAEITHAYATARGEEIDIAELATCHVHQGLMWIGWAGDWIAPVEHRTDWIEVACSFLGPLERLP
jgi:aminoglycoside phosphotransferase (APT) family kinase protein